MTDEVGELVLRDNVLQNLALSMTEQLGLDAARRADAADAQARDAGPPRPADRVSARATPSWPSGASAGAGLTRPEAAVLLAYAKMTLYEDLLKTELPDRAYLAERHRQIFSAPAAPAVHAADRAAPTEARDRRHLDRQQRRQSRPRRVRLRARGRDRAARSRTSCWPTWPRATRSGCSPIWGAIEALPASVPGELQPRLLLVARDVLLRGTRWYMTQGGRPFKIVETVSRFRPGIARSWSIWIRWSSPAHAAASRSQRAEYVAGGRRAGAGPVHRRIAASAGGLRHRVRVAGARCRRCATAASRPHLFRAGPCARPALAEEPACRPRRGAGAGTVWRLTGVEDDLSRMLRALTAAAMAAGLGSSDVRHGGRQCRGLAPAPAAGTDALPRSARRNCASRRRRIWRC